MSISDYFSRARQLAYRDLEQMTPESIANSDTDYVIAQFVNKYFLPVIEKDPNRDEQHGKEILMEGVKVTLIYPLKADVNIRQACELRPSTNRLGVRIDYYPDKNCFLTTEFIPNEATNAPDRLMAARQNIMDHINWLNADINIGNAELRKNISDRYFALKKLRIKQLSDVDNWIKKLPVKLVEVTSGSRPTPLKLPEDPKIVAIVQSKQKPEEPKLDRGQVNTIVELIANTGHYFERTPGAFSRQEEEVLRDLILAGLNTYFKGAAGGETFSKAGKTDIHLTISSKDVLIGECKKWHGEAGYKGTIDQLFRYTIWRDSFGLIVTFSDKQGFTDVLRKAKEETKRHETFVNDSLQELGTGHFVSKHIKAEDEARHIEVHHLLFNIYFQ